ncbi:MAG: hypothetical protein ACRDQ5_02395 [Sciscionella sp.]
MTDNDAITTAESAGSQANQPAGQEEPEEITAEEVMHLQEYQQTTTNAAVRTLLAELIPLLNRVQQFTHQTGSGGGYTRKADGTTSSGEQRYAINYSTSPDSRDWIAVLVHELTHVAIDVAYDADMLNYPVPALTGPRPASEEERQNLRLKNADQDARNTFRVYVLQNVSKLIDLIPGSGLPPDKQRETKRKLTMHTAMKPEHEYDAVLSHLLVWCDTYPEAQSSDFQQSLAALVAETQQWRTARQVNPPTHPENKTQDDLIAEIMGKQNSLNVAAPPAPAQQGRTGRGRRLRERLTPLFNKLRHLFPRSGRG